MKTSFRSAGLCVTFLAALISCQALPVTLDIDFRTWSGANGIPSFSLDGITVIASASDNGNPVSALLTQGPAFGLGIDSDVDIPPPGTEDPTKIGPREILTVLFDPATSGQAISGAWLTQLMAGSGALSDGGTLVLVSTTGTQTIPFTASDASSDLFIGFGPLHLQSATFIGDTDFLIFNRDFSVVGFERQTSAVPDSSGSSALLFAGVLAGLGAVSRRTRLLEEVR